MLKLLRTNPLLRKSIGKFWILTALYSVLLLILRGIIPIVYDTIINTLNIDVYIPFMILHIGFGLLIWKILKTDHKSDIVLWKPWESILLSCLALSILHIALNIHILLLLLLPKGFTILYFTSLNPSYSEILKNTGIILILIYLSSIYFLIKLPLWYEYIIEINNIETNKKNLNQQDQDLSLDIMDGFELASSLPELKKFDKLGRFDHARQISHVINNIEPAKSFAIGINGEWGSGKTSFIHLVRRTNQIEYPKHCKFITFNPWYFTGTEKVLVKFHETLLSEIGHFSISLRRELQRYFQLICKMETSLWQTNFLQHFHKQDNFQSQLKNLKQHFKTLPQRIVIIIDDMDRLQEDEVRVLFRTMRLIADFPNVIYLVGYDPDYIATILEEKPEDNKSSFMEKIFQLEFDLPAPLSSDLKDFWKIKLKKYDSDISAELQNDLINFIVNKQIIPNLRDIKRFINQISISSSLPEIRSNVYFPQFFLLELIYYTDPASYNKIQVDSLKTLEFPKEHKLLNETHLLLEKIKSLSNKDERSVTKKDHFEKYFFKRLDKQVEIDYQDVEAIFENENFERNLKEFYFLNESILTDHILHFIDTKNEDKETVDKTLGIKYLERIIYLLEFSYKSKGFDKKYFELPLNLNGQRLISGITNIWKTFSYNNGNFITEFKAYLNSKIELKCFSYLLNELSNRNPYIGSILLDLNSIFRDRISNELEYCQSYPYPILIDLYNYQLFFNSLNNNNKYCALNDPEIKNKILSNSEIIYTGLQQVITSNKDLDILKFLGTSEYLLALNDMQNQGVFNILDRFLSGTYYPIIKENKTNSFYQTFKYDSYNYSIKPPLSIRSMTFHDEEDEILYELTFNDSFIKTKHHKDIESKEKIIELLRPVSDNFFFQFFRGSGGTCFNIVDMTDNIASDEFGTKLISEDSKFEFKISITSENNENYTLKRHVIPKNVLKKIEAINSKMV